MSKAGEAVSQVGELDLRAIGRALWRRKLWIVVPTIVVALSAAVAVNLITPRYKSEARILYDGRENVFLRPEAERTQIDRSAADQEALTSQVQLVLSRELALQVVAELELNKNPEFDPLIDGLPLYKTALVFLGVSRDPYRMTPEERVLEAYFDRLTAFAVDKSRVIAIEFQSWDPLLAARAANAIAQGYIRLQQTSKQQETQAASQWLAGEIGRLRHEVSDAEARVEEFRSHSGLYIGTNNTTLSNQQLGELNTQLGAARAQKADAEVRAAQIREMLRRGDQIEVSDLFNSDIMRRMSEQRAARRAQLAEQSSTLLDNHPRIKELKAEIADYDRQIRAEADKLARTLETDSKIAAARVQALSANLDALKRQAATSNEDDVRLRALERDAKSKRDLLESYLAKYREASARESIGSAPADARIISRAIVSNTPFFPRKLPIVLVATLATLAIFAGLVTAGELMRATAPVSSGRWDQPDAPAASPVFSAPVAAPAGFAPERDAPVAEAAPAAPVAAPMAPDLAPSPDPAADLYEEEAPPHAVAAAAIQSPPAPTPELDRSAGPAAAPLAGGVVSSIDDLADHLRGPAGRRVAMFGSRADARSSQAAIAIARLLARDTLVVLVRLAAGGATEGEGPGIVEMIRGEATFGEIITRDKVSRAHLVPRGNGEADTAALLRSLRFVTMIDALAQTYDHVVIDAGPVEGLDLEPMAELAPAGVLVVPEASDPAAATAEQRLSDAGYGTLIMLVGAPLVAPTPQPEAA